MLTAKFADTLPMRDLNGMFRYNGRTLRGNLGYIFATANPLQNGRR